MPAARLLLVALAVAGAAGAGYYFFFSRSVVPSERPPALPPVESASQPEAAKPAEPAVATLPTPQSSGIPVEDCIVYPDGTRLPPLNGVKKAPPLVFHKLAPFARVVRKEVDARGIEWYVHENGVRSTTRLQANGEAVAEIEMATAPAPVAHDK